MLHLAGAEPLFGTPGAHSPWLEWDDLVEADPDAIVLMPCGFDIARTRAELAPLLNRAGFAELRAMKGRGARKRLPLASGGSLLLIDDSYNANPASMRAAFEVLAQSRPAARGRRIAVLGDMLELGTSAERHDLSPRRVAHGR